MAYMANFNDVAGEKPFLFKIGADEQDFYVHPSVLKTVSHPSYKMMTNGLQESIAGVAKLDVEVEVFRLFMQWAYSRTYYSPPELDLLCTAADSRPSPNFTQLDLRISWEAREGYKEINGFSLQDTMVLMEPILHAKLYDFADMYLVDHLKCFVRYRLHEDLLYTNIDAAGAQAAFNALSYIYDTNDEPCDMESDEHTGSGTDNIVKMEARAGDVKGLLVAYVIDCSKHLFKIEGFTEVFRGRHQLTMDVMRRLGNK